MTSTRWVSDSMTSVRLVSDGVVEARVQVLNRFLKVHRAVVDIRGVLMLAILKISLQRLHVETNWPLKRAHVINLGEATVIFRVGNERLIHTC